MLSSVWRNSYGSTMTLQADGNRLSGLYASTTGSSGTYPVDGWISDEDRSATGLGRAVGLTLSWHSLGGEAPDPSWHYVSLLGGQLFDEDGEPCLRLTHLLLAPRSFPGLCDAGSYIDQLSFAPDHCAASAALPPVEMQGERIRMECNSFTSDLQVSAIQGSRIGHATGTVEQDGLRTPLTGFVDLTADQVVAAAFSWQAPNAGAVHGFAGLLDRQNSRIEGTELTSRSTPPGSRYVQTALTHRQWSLDWARGPTDAIREKPG